MDWKFTLQCVGLGLLVAATVDGCSTIGQCVFPAHADLCDPQDFDPKCLLSDCREHDAGPATEVP